MTETGGRHLDQQLTLTRWFQLKLDDLPLAGLGE